MWSRKTSKMTNFPRKRAVFGPNILVSIHLSSPLPRDLFFDYTLKVTKYRGNIGKTAFIAPNTPITPLVVRANSDPNGPKQGKSEVKLSEVKLSEVKLCDLGQIR